MTTQPGMASKLLFSVFLFAVFLIGIGTGLLAVLGALLQLGSSYLGVASMVALLGSAALGFGHGIWAALMFSHRSHRPAVPRAGLYLGAVTVAGAVTFLVALFGRPFMNPYIVTGFFWLCVVPQFLIGLATALASVRLVRRTRTRM